MLSSLAAILIAGAVLPQAHAAPSPSPTAAVTTTCNAAAAVVPSAPPVGNYVYNGCWHEANNTRTLVLASLLDPVAMTVEVCETFCSAGGFPAFGVEFGQEWYCGTYLRDNVTQTDQLSCLQPCVGGGPALLDVYILENYTQPSIPQSVGASMYQGCFTEAPSPNRALNMSQFDSEAMTVEACEASCSAGDFTFFGTDFSSQCFCGNELGFGSSIAPGGDSECSMTCAGNYTEFCGDANRLNVYELTA
jgi:hypothetical protein